MIIKARAILGMGRRNLICPHITRQRARQTERCYFVKAVAIFSDSRRYSGEGEKNHFSILWLCLSLRCVWVSFCPPALNYFRNRVACLLSSCVSVCVCVFSNSAIDFSLSNPHWEAFLFARPKFKLDSIQFKSGRVWTKSTRANFQGKPLTEASYSRRIFFYNLFFL